MMRDSTILKIMNTNKKLIIGLFAVILFIYLSFVYSFFSIIAFLISLVYLFILPTNKYIVFLCSLLPWAYVFKIDGLSTSLFVILFLVSTVVLLLRENKLSQAFLLLLFIFTLIILLHFTIDGLNSALTLIKILIGLVFVYLSCHRYSNKDLPLIILLFVSSTLISSLVAFLMKDQSALINRISLDENIIDFTFARFKGLQNDPNYYNSSLIICLLGAYYLFEKRIIRFSFFLFVGLLIWFGLLTYSKSFFLLLAFWLLAITIYSIKKKNIFLTLFFAALLCLAIYIASSGRIELINVVLKRFSDTNGDFTTGRLDIWNSYLNHFSNNIGVLFFGNGLESLLLDGSAAHNSYIDFIYYFGIIGTLLFFAMILISFKNVKRPSFFGIIFTSFVGVIYFFISGVVACELPFMLFFCYIFLVNSNHESETIC